MSHHDDHSGHGDHSHNHSHDHGDDGHDHTDEIEPALQTLIWKQIDFDNVRTLNESEPDAGLKVVKKTWQQRLVAQPELVSDAGKLLIRVVICLYLFHLVAVWRCVDE